MLFENNQRRERLGNLMLKWTKRNKPLSIYSRSLKRLFLTLKLKVCKLSTAFRFCVCCNNSKRLQYGNENPKSLVKS